MTDSLKARMEALKYHKDCGNEHCKAYFAGVDDCIALLDEWRKSPEQRKAFETRFAEELILSRDILPEKYDESYTETAWRAWQAALSTITGEK